MRARLKNPALMHPQVLQAMLAADKATSGLDFCDTKAGPFACQPDQWLRRMCGHACARTQIAGQRK
jgi:hypothetical protein